MKIGILGGGQLAQMMAIEGKAQGHEFMFLSDDPHSCAAPFGELVCASFDDTRAQDRLAKWADVITYEFENVPIETVKRLESSVTLHPSFSALSVARDRLLEKRLFRTLKIPTAEFYSIDSLEQLENAYTSMAQAAILKTRTQGYDGKGQVVISDPEQLSSAWQKIGEVPCILESKVNFKREISIIAARTRSGDIEYYPLSENIHSEGILRLSTSITDDAFQAQAEDLVSRLLNHLDYVGVIALELFQVGDELFANEFAPRVHNTGHWTIEGSNTSQFSNHINAICGLPLGKTTVPYTAGMINLIGSLPSAECISKIPNATLHTYGKEDRPGRKVGHITLLSDTVPANEAFNASIKTLLQIAAECDLANSIP